MEMKELISDLTDRIQRTANVRAVFGEPIREGDTVIVPVARVTVRGGGGGGGDAAGFTDTQVRKQRDGGIGLGLNIVAAPVGYIKMSSGGAVFVPILDKNRVLFGVMGLMGLSLWVIRAGIKIGRHSRV